MSERPGAVEDPSQKAAYPPGFAHVSDYRTWVRRLVRLAIRLGVFPNQQALVEAAGIDGATLSNAMTRRRHLTEEILRRFSGFASFILTKPHHL